MGLLDALQDEQFRKGIAKGLRDVGQSASNTVADNVGVPVDALSWALRKIGMPIPQNPVGGTDWMAQQGLTRPVQDGAPKLAGEALGLLAPLAGTKQGAQATAGLLNKYADNLAAPRAMNPQAGAIVWHGSPHKFDAFDASKIGTGEGAQAYGHGLYLAESPDVAGQYQKMLSGKTKIDGGSRGAGTGSSNYVVFPGNEGLLKILERNGVPLK